MAEETPKEGIITYRALHQCVVAVAVRRIEGTWKAYIADVPGQHHDWEFEEVADYGDQLDEAIAKAIFPHIDIPYSKM